MSGENKRLHAFVSGIVQGVGFRYFVNKQAQRLGITGFVRNLYDGRVEVVAEGSNEKLQLLLAELHKGPAFGRVDKVETEWLNATGGFDRFQVTF